VIANELLNRRMRPSACPTLNTRNRDNDERAWQRLLWAFAVESMRVRLESVRSCEEVIDPGRLGAGDDDAWSGDRVWSILQDASTVESDCPSTS
jgi:hypothetical protein